MRVISSTSGVRRSNHPHPCPPCPLPDYREREKSPRRDPSSGTYYAVVRLNGKQFKSSLETKSLPEARR